MAIDEGDTARPPRRPDHPIVGPLFPGVSGFVGPLMPSLARLVGEAVGALQVRGLPNVGQFLVHVGRHTFYWQSPVV